MLVTCLFAGTFLAILAPLGTETFPLPIRFVFWVGMCIIGGLGAAATHVFEKVFSIKLSNWQCAITQSITASLAVASALFLLTLFKYGPPHLSQTVRMFFYTWIISAAISVVGMLLRKSENPKPTQTRPALYERLQPKLRSAEIYALSAEDHYVRVITSKGDELVLMRLTDAIRETAPLKGLSPHRSWWVSESGVDTIKKTNIVLPKGQTVPISRSGMKLVKEAGWI